MTTLVLAHNFNNITNLFPKTFFELLIHDNVYSQFSFTYCYHSKCHTYGECVVPVLFFKAYEHLFPTTLLCSFK